jgi:hypothetical protein
MIPAVESKPMEVLFEFPSRVQDLYHHCLELDHWFVKYFGKWPFDASVLKNKQIPHSHRPQGSKPCRGFNEFYMATQYIEAGYEVLLYYRSPKENHDTKSYDIAKRLLKGDLGGIIHIGPPGESPDMLVFRGNQFRFVECKAKDEDYTSTQLPNFRRIDQILNSGDYGEPLSDPARTDLFPESTKPDHLRWIHAVRLVEKHLESHGKI